MAFFITWTVYGTHLQGDELGWRKIGEGDKLPVPLLADWHRERLNHAIKLLDENQRMTVTEIYVKLRLEQSVASQHLAILRRAGIVATQRDGKFIFYTVNYHRVSELTRFVDDVIK